MTGPGQWADADVMSVSTRAGGADPRDVRAVLDRYGANGLNSPVAFALSPTNGGLMRDLSDARKARTKAEARRARDDAEKGPHCGHGVAGGAALNPQTGLPWCPMCRASYRAADPAPARPGDSGDNGLSPDTGRKGQAGQALQAAGDSGDNDLSPPRLATVTAASLKRRTFPAPRYAVRGLIPEGAILLSGAPKVGKSWLLLGICAAVAAGTPALGGSPTDKGDVLYLALEDTERRLQRRLRQQLGTSHWPAGLEFALQCSPLPDCTALISRWLDDHPGARLVVVDVLERIRAPFTAGEPRYSADYKAMRSLHNLAARYPGVAILVAHHTRKEQSDDFVESASGTYGLAGAADTVIELRRPRGGQRGTLSITGRDVEENSWALEFDPDSGQWTIMGKTTEYGLADTRQAILDAMPAAPGTATPSEIVGKTGLDPATVKQTMGRMVKDNQLEKNDQRGHYRRPTPTEPVTTVTKA
jgi:hypothetical protein